MESSLKTTPLNQWHHNAGANMADFGGYEMPLWYNTGVKNEHLAVLTSAGIFDTSHMACILVKGDNAFDLLQFCFTRDIAGLKTGRCVYGAFLSEQGFCLDDAIVYKFSDTVFMICVNAGMGSAIAGHLSSHNKPYSAQIEDLSGKIAKMDIQGKDSAKIMSRILKNPDQVFESMPYFSFKGGTDPLPEHTQVLLLDGTPVLLSRSGYTGEFGFEIFAAPNAITGLWESILKAGNDFNVTPCGLGARDSLRTGAVLPLSHQDIGNWPFVNHPWEFALPHDETGSGFTKNFIGKSAIESHAGARHVYPFAGENLRKVGTGDQTRVLTDKGTDIGHVLTCTTDMGIGWHENKIVSIASPDKPEDFRPRGISCGFVMVDRALDYGTGLVLQEGKRSISVKILQDIRPDRTARKKITSFI